MQAVLRLEKHGAGMRGKRTNDDGFELFELLAWHGLLFDFQFGGEQAAQRVTLVDGKRGNNAAFPGAITIEPKMPSPKGAAFQSSISSL